MNEILRIMNDQNLTIGALKITPERLAQLIGLVDEGVINNNTAKSLLASVQKSGKDPAVLVQELGLGLVSDEGALRAACQKVVTENPAEANAYRGGKEALLGWFTGQVMRALGGKADAQKTRAILMELLK